jgi:hypothetical protein
VFLLAKVQISFYFLRCVIAELFLEGQPLFELSQLLAYRRGQHDPSQHLEKVLYLCVCVSYFVLPHGPISKGLYPPGHTHDSVFNILNTLFFMGADTRYRNPQDDSAHDSVRTRVSIFC